MSSADATHDQPKYARFTRRLQALMIDSIVMSLLLALVISIAVALNSNNAVRVLGFSVVAIFLLYEPVLVSLTGSTLGHLATNLRVVDNSSHRNLSFPKAVARTVIKAVLGLYSFVTMAFTRRYQALHDILTRSSVQIRNPDKARPHHYVAERLQFADVGLPSPARRISVIVLYVLAMGAVLWFSDALLIGPNMISDACVDHDVCSPRENAILYGIFLTCFILVVICMVQGWRGRLWGARRRT
jgi:uncharacterized RDD family membrane protein YckC